MSASTILAQVYGSESVNLYTDVLEVSSDATPAQLRKAYYRKALQCHPDKTSNPQDTLKFQALSMTYEILKDPQKRKEYDETGKIVDNDDGDDFEANGDNSNMWTDYFTHVFGKVSTSQIDQFAQQYKCSDEEEQDVLKYYRQFQGNLTKMLDHVMLSTHLDCSRWVEDFITPAIENGTVPDYMTKVKQTLKTITNRNNDTSGTTNKKNKKKPNKKASTKSSAAITASSKGKEDVVIDEDETESEDDDDDDGKVEMKPKSRTQQTKPKSKQPKKTSKNTKAKTKRMSKAEREAAEAQTLMDKIRNEGTLHRKAGFDSMLSGIQNRYGGIAQDDDPFAHNEDEFQQIQAKLVASKESNKKTRNTKKKKSP
mmetsp:Transcript_4167/g.5986  ORF Transcript_4167/g.5986 Transcript_4167/m.5986 type:complete len:369 (+) Transcript_4167:148-1254(+)